MNFNSKQEIKKSSDHPPKSRDPNERHYSVKQSFITRKAFLDSSPRGSEDT